MKHIISEIIVISFPSFISLVISGGYVLINIVYAGNISSFALSGIGLCNLFIFGLWFTTYSGVNGAL